MRLAFMGTPAFSVPALAELIAGGHEIAAVYTQPPRPAGRGLAERRSPVHDFADAHGLSVRTPASLKSPAEQAAFAALDLDAAVVVAYGLILPQAILDAPRLGCINVHASLLPRWRGAAPIQRAILAGDRETGVMTMQMDAGLDTGPILLAERCPIGPETTAGALHDRLAELGAGLLNRTLAGLDRGQIEPRPQPEAGVTYAAKITAEDGALNWSAPAPVLHRIVRAMAPAPGAWFTWEGARVKVLRARIMPDHGPPGTALDDRLTIACGEDALQLLELQRAGRSAMAAAEFLRGRPVPAGTVLG